MATQWNAACPGTESVFRKAIVKPWVVTLRAMGTTGVWPRAVANTRGGVENGRSKYTSTLTQSPRWLPGLTENGTPNSGSDTSANPSAFVSVPLSTQSVDVLAGGAFALVANAAA